MALDFHLNRPRLAGILLGLAALLLAAPAGANAIYKQPGFTEKVVFTGLVNPTVVRFLPDGRVLVAEKSGLIKLFDSLTDDTPTTVADLRTKVHNFWDRGFLGLAVPPGFDAASLDPWRREIYVLYTHDALIGGTAPKWGVVNGTSDPCPSPPTGPGPTTDGCVVSGRLSRLEATGADWALNEDVLIEDWCQQFPSHATGAIDFGADEKLYVSGGDGASFGNTDWGQYGGTVQVQGNPGTYYTPANPCADPPFPIGTLQTKPTAEGGALRSQSPRRTAGEPRLLNGAILRVDPWTGDPLPDNPLFASADENEQRTIAYGLRNPFRTIVKPGTNEVFAADVGWGTWEELNWVPDFSTVRNFGWPCFEGNATQYTGLNICPAQAQTTAPLLTYNHGSSVVTGDGCSTGGSSVAGMAFYQGGSNYPASFDDALFFSDYSRKCVWVMYPNGSGNPDPASTAAFASSVVTGPVDLQIGPDGNLYYVDFNGGTIVRVVWGLNAVAAATSPTAGPLPLLVSFDGTGSQVVTAGDTLTYAWDLDGDGQYDDSTASQPSFNYTNAGTFNVRLRITDNHGGFDISDPIPVYPGNSPPTATILTPSASFTWKVGDTIAFTGEAEDPETGDLADTALSWEILIQHCPSDCHSHTYETFPGVAGGSVSGPDHEYPAYIEIRLTATDPVGLTHTTSVSVQPQTVNLNFQSNPTGLQLQVGTAPATTPFSRTVIVGSQNGLDAPSPQGSFPDIWDFSAWSDAGAQSHTITAPASPATYTATFVKHADLALGMTASPEPVGAGATLTYTLNVSNAGPSQATALSVSANLPAGSSFVSASGAGWTCGGTGPVTCTLPSLGIAAASPIAIAVTAPSAAGAISGNATVTASTSDPVSANDSASANSTVFARADLSITQSGAPASICTSQPIAYALNVSNAGPSTATSVSVTDVLPAGAALVSASGSGWACSGTTTVTCTRASLSTGAAPAITVSITAPSSAGTATNTASVSSSTNDPSSANNSSSAATTVNAIPAPPTAGNGGAVCAGATLQLTASTVVGATYAWTGPNGFSSALQNPAIPGATPAASGTYSVTVTVNACTSTAATTVATVRTLPTAAVSGGATICQGASTTIQAALTGTSPWTVIWSDGVTQSGVAASPATRSVSPASSTTYTVTSVSDANCAGTASGSAAVTVNPKPTAVASGTAEICAGASTPLSGSGGVSCSWAPAAGLSNAASCSPTASPAATTVYTLTVTSASGCVSTNAPTVTVTVNPKPTAAVSGTAAICIGASTTIQAALTGEGPWSVVWSDGVTQSNVPASPATRSVSPAASTTYTVTSITDANCAGTSSGSAAVTVNAKPTAAVSGTAEICVGSSTTIQAALTGAGPWSVVWSDGVTQSNVAVSPATRGVSPAASTTYTVTSVSDANCTGTSSGSAAVTVNPKPTAAVSGTAQICAGGSTSIQAALTGEGPWTVVWSDGVTQPSVAASPATRSVSPAASTTYTVTSVTDANCAGTSSGNAVVTVNPKPTATVSGTAAICLGASTTIQAALTGTGPWTVVWSDGVTQSNVAASPASRSVSPAASTTYTVTSVSDANCGTGTASGSAAVTVNPNPTAAASGTAEICAGASTPLSGSGGVSCSWAPSTGLSNAASCSPAASPVATTTYTLTVTSASGCVSTNAPTVTVTVNPKPTAAVSGAAAICIGASTTIQAALTGEGPWSVIWSDGVTQSNVPASPATRSVSPASSTTYTVTSVTDVNCAGTSSGSAAVTVNAKPTAAVSGTAAICLGASTTIQAALTGTGPWTVIWSDGVTQSNVAASPATRSVSPAATTTYTVTSVSDANCTGTSSGSAAVTVNPKPTAAVSGTAQICAGSSTTIQAALTGTGPWTVIWSDGVTQSGVAASPATRSVSPASSTTYTVTSVTDANCAGTSSGSAAVTVTPKPTATVSGTAAICLGASTTIQAALTGTSPWTVIWSDGVTQSGVVASPATRSVSPASSTTYTVTSVSDANCAGTASGSAAVTVNPKPTAVASGTAEICAGASTPLSGSGGVSCSWAPAAGLSNAASCSPTASPGATTTYTLTVTSASGCVSTNAPTVTVTVNPKPTAAVSGTAAICIGASTTIQAALTGEGPWTVIWSDGVTQSNVAASPATRSVSPASSTTYTVTSVTDANCAGTSSGSAAVTVNPHPTAVASGAAEICAGDSTPLSGSGGASCSWAPAAGLSNPASCSPTASPVATTTYTLTVTDASGCVSVNAPTVTVVVNPRPTAAVSGTAAICAGSSTNIQAALTGSGPWTVVWSDGVTQSNVVASPATRSVSPAASTTYTVTSVSDSNCAGNSSGSAVVTVTPHPTAVASGTSEICAGGSTLLSGSGGVSCSWAPAAGLSNPASCAPTATPSTTTTYTLTVTGASGCVSVNAPAVTVTVNPIPPPPAASNDGPACEGETLQLSAATVAGASYSWTGPNGFASALQNPSIPNATPAASGLYSVTVSVDGCASAAGTTSAAVFARPSALVSGTATICQGGSTQISAALTGTGPWSLTWSDGVVQSAGASPATRTVSPVSTTTYTVTALLDAHCAGSGTAGAVVTVGSPVAAPAIAAPESATVGATGLSASVETHDGSTYAWTISGGAITAGQGTSAVTFNAGAPGTTMTLEVVETNTGCASPAATAKVQVDFLDVPPLHLFHDFVNTVARNGVTAGCGDGNYCPDNPNTRAQMAVFLLKSKLGADHVPPPATGAAFLDVPASDPFAPWIEEVAALGVTSGCGGGNYCPGAPVTRAQMAVFLLKMLEGAAYVPPPATGTIFGDVPLGAFAAAWIENVYSRGITGGCQANPLLYCPGNTVTRGQMAVFLVKTFALP